MKRSNKMSLSLRILGKQATQMQEVIRLKVELATANVPSKSTLEKKGAVFVTVLLAKRLEGL